MTKPSSASGVTFRSIDDLFEPTDGSSDKPQLAELDVESLIPFKDHPFRVVDDDRMMETVESVREYGVLVPIIARPIEDGLYEICKRVKADPTVPESVAQRFRDYIEDKEDEIEKKY